MTDNPLIADNRPESGSGPVSMDNLGFRNMVSPDALEGAGPMSGFVSAVQNMERGDLAGAWTDIGGIGFDALGIIENPMRVFLGAGIGWLIEHFGILNEILSVMAGDPTQVADHAQTWTNIGDHINSRVRDLQASVAKLSAASSAVDGYRVAVNDFARAVVLSGDAAYRAADGTNTAATVVATTRSVIRDWFADWAAGRVMRWFGIGPLTPVTFGGAQAAFIADSVVSGARMATRATKELRKLVKHLEDLAATAKAGNRSLTDAAAALRKAADGTTGATTKAARLLGVKSPGVPRDGALLNSMENLGKTASKHVDGMDDAMGDAAAAAARRAETGAKIGSRKAPPKGRVTEAAHASAKRAQNLADSRVATHSRKLSEVDDAARGIAQRIADDTATAIKERLGELGEKAAGLAAQTTKEAIIQTSNEDMRAENAQKGYLEQNATSEVDERPVRRPSELDVDENVLPGEPLTAGPAPQPVRQETWQVRGTLDP
ncbi:MAG: hypothetical protein WBA97_39215 [Actinophytocola sp.]|uniref:hypothetical protein n=1 Tax=Actinophytocola sp. TaxID=1872138 RepID=UPI003C771F6C